MKIAIRLGEAVSLSNPQGYKVTPDDRQQKIETIGGVVVEDYGHIEAGDVTSFTVNFSKKNFEIIKSYWENRILIEYEDVAGEIFKNVRIVIKSYSYIERFKNYYTATLEIWRV